MCSIWAVGLYMYGNREDRRTDRPTDWPTDQRMDRWQLHKCQKFVRVGDLLIYWLALEHMLLPLWKTNLSTNGVLFGF